MINVLIYYNHEKKIIGFDVSGHAGFAQEGNDIVCAAVSVLVCNTINCIELFADKAFVCEADEKNGGLIEWRFTGSVLEEKTQLLLNTMVHGLKDIEKEYPDYVKVNDREVQ